jgi:predicted RNA-binding protein with PUA-like domain
MNYWLIKSDPDTYPFEKMIADKRTFWDGVRNYQARNNLKAMKKGDLCLFYNSVTDPRVCGIVEVVKESYQDPTTDDTAWVVVDVKYKSKLKKEVSLKDIKANRKLQDMTLLKASRLSVQPVTKDEFDEILSMSEL